MEIKDFIKKARLLGYDEEDIQEEVELYEDAKAEGIKIPLELFFNIQPFNGY